MKNFLKILSYIKSLLDSRQNKKTFTTTVNMTNITVVNVYQKKYALYPNALLN